MKAVETDSPEMVQLLLEHGADVHKRGWYGDTALSEAKDSKNLTIIQMLKRAGAKQ